MQDGADTAAGEEESSDEDTSDSSSSSSSSDVESVAAATAGRHAGQQDQEVDVSLVVSPTCLVLRWHESTSSRQHHVFLGSCAMGG